jgi:hypothetical protein
MHLEEAKKSLLRLTIVLILFSLKKEYNNLVHICIKYSSLLALHFGSPGWLDVGPYILVASLSAVLPLP